MPHSGQALPEKRCMLYKTGRITQKKRIRIALMDKVQKIYIYFKAAQNIDYKRSFWVQQ